MKHTVRTNVGVVRSENQDRANIFIVGEYTFVILCDGMGGHEGGSHASSITIDTFEREINNVTKYSEEQFGKWFTKSLNRSKKEMTKFSNGDAKLLDMGTTVTAALIYNGNIYIFNVGDSRTYIYNGLLTQITVDHNLRNHYIKKFGYSEEQAATVMGAAALTSALGPKKKANIELFKLPLSNDVEYVVLTSDGIHDYISKPNFETIISANVSIEEKGDILINEAIRGKSSDNLTVAIVEVK